MADQIVEGKRRKLLADKNNSTEKEKKGKNSRGTKSNFSLHLSHFYKDCLLSLRHT